MEFYLTRQQLLILLAVAVTALLFILSLIGLLSYRVVEEQRAATSRVTQIVREMNGYRVYWAGSAEVADITAYDVQFCQVPCAAWSDWQTGVTETSAWFGPDEGKHFGFRVRAHASDGHAEPWPASASMTTEQAKGE